MRYILCLVVLLLFGGPALAVDNGQYSNVDQATRDWVASLQATGSRYICCSLTDGQIVADQDWDYGKDTYTVYITPPEGRLFTDGSKGKWVSVPPEAVVLTWAGLRKIGHALVWVSWQYDPNGDIESFSLRCFLPGSGV